MMRPIPLVTAAVLAVALLLPAQAATASVPASSAPTTTRVSAAAYPTDYVKYPWSSTVYSVTFYPGGENAWRWSRIDFAQYADAGFPAVRNAGYIAGSYLYKWGTSPEILVEGPDGVNHKLSAAEWRDMGYRRFADRGNEGFQRLSWTSDIVRMSDLRGGQGRAIGFGEWQEEAFPTPQVVQRITGDQFYRYDGSDQIWYAGPGMNRVVSYSEWAAAGFPYASIRGGGDGGGGQPVPPPSNGGGGQPPRPGDRNCGDFGSQAEAQAFFDQWYPLYGDFAGLDGDGDRRACNGYFG
ncbi:hypothetical protein JOE38_001559 [Clavibacter michiganensis]|uniref:hypothetical protein n=1 Tax=Clavibacter michiganensis TaxID=28447 RepID=UPI0019573246|nr:hypothetical protein [Clavibacter michiganensis]MBM7411736.1 hypothetical protein [Clavibacter michiganensis]